MGKKEPYGTAGNIKGYGDSFNHVKYAFLAAPINLSAGRWMYAVNEDNTIWKISIPPGYSASYSPGKLGWSGGPIAPGAAYPQSPMSEGWGKMD
jgi:hypothetical protein